MPTVTKTTYCSFLYLIEMEIFLRIHSVELHLRLLYVYLAVSGGPSILTHS